MPTYQYACTVCGERLEVVQRFSDEPLVECPSCRGRLRKLFSPVGIVFKGSGFYKTDSRSRAKSSTSSSPASDPAPDRSSPTESAGPSAGGTGSSESPAATSTDGSSKVA